MRAAPGRTGLGSYGSARAVSGHARLRTPPRNGFGGLVLIAANSVGLALVAATATAEAVPVPAAHISNTPFNLPYEEDE
ncbi:hypothetical protein [Streptomyces sp. NPDC054865]